MASLRRCDTPRPLDLPRDPKQNCAKDEARSARGRSSRNGRRKEPPLIGDLGTERLLDELTTIVSAAAAAVLAARAGPLDTRSKADRSPVTAADHASEAVILEGLGGLLPP